jgi:hypothetical protein
MVLDSWALKGSNTVASKQETSTEKPDSNSAAQLADSIACYISCAPRHCAVPLTCCSQHRMYCSHRQGKRLRNCYITAFGTAAGSQQVITFTWACMTHLNVIGLTIKGSNMCSCRYIQAGCQNMQPK